MTWGIVLCMASGWVLGIIVSLGPNQHALEMTLTDINKTDQPGIYSAISLNTSQILSRGPPVGNVVSSLIVAILSGIAIALGQSSGISSALAGCAMSTSLLPPLVEVGLMFGFLPWYGNIQTINGHTIMQVAGYSMALYVVNVSAVMGFAWLTFKIKHIGGKTLRSMASPVGKFDQMPDLHCALDEHNYMEDESEESVIQDMLSPRGAPGHVDNLDHLNPM